MIELTNINKYFGKHHVLKDITFKVDKGEIVGFIGPNGSGKSTTMKCIARLVFPDSGEITIGNHSVKKQPKEALQKLSTLIESPGLYPNLTGLEHLRLFAGLWGVHKSKIDDIVESIQLGNGIGKVTRKYSMGMKQRLGLGIALLSEPEYLILDEPFSGLDPQGIFELRNTLVQIAQNGVALLISSHQLLELEKVTTRNIFIKNGELVDRNEIEKEQLTLAYKITFSNHQVMTSDTVDKLKNLSLISKCEMSEGTCILWLTQEASLSATLEVLIHDHYLVHSIIPVDRDLESLYMRLF
ncbi:ABC transporter ATP-binding protein [Fusibacter bizertensis]